tara:strand:- start:12316 stop:12618 length:303 start_codon:yes stop_codon:yes gene_type:complete
MLAVERTTKLFVRSLEQAGVNFKISIEKSRTAFGQSNYVLIRHANALKFWKVRISDHPVGMRRALTGSENLHIPAGAKPSSWAVWMGMLVREHASQKADA